MWRTELFWDTSALSTCGSNTETLGDFRRTDEACILRVEQRRTLEQKTLRLQGVTRCARARREEWEAQRAVEEKRSKVLQGSRVEVGQTAIFVSRLIDNELTTNSQSRRVLLSEHGFGSFGAVPMLTLSLAMPVSPRFACASGAGVTQRRGRHGANGTTLVSSNSGQSTWSSNSRANTRTSVCLPKKHPGSLSSRLTSRAAVLTAPTRCSWPATRHSTSPRASTCACGATRCFPPPSKYILTCSAVAVLQKTLSVLPSTGSGRRCFRLSWESSLCSFSSE